MAAQDEHLDQSSGLPYLRHTRVWSNRIQTQDLRYSGTLSCVRALLLAPYAALLAVAPPVAPAPSMRNILPPSRAAMTRAAAMLPSMLPSTLVSITSWMQHTRSRAS